MQKTLNLVNPNDISSVGYKISKYPDGQQSLKLSDDERNPASVSFIGEVNVPIKIISRLNSFMDLELIICATQALKEFGYKSIELYIPYCIGGRSDRKFEKGGFNYIKTIIAPIINSQQYEKVFILDPHSDVLEACINNMEKISNKSLIDLAFSDYFRTKDIKSIKLVSPDAGSLKKIYEVANYIGYEDEIVIASKNRNVVTGKITDTNVRISANDAWKDIFIIDDICDGGRTFIEIAKAIETTRSLSSAVHPKQHGNIYLIVTHGIFSSGLSELSKHFKKIYCTNSIIDIPEDTLFLFKNEMYMGLVKQYKIF
jgi:ribose-phosphate pyrophosphokinase